jgi:hypothetical protein
MMKMMTADETVRWLRLESAVSMMMIIMMMMTMTMTTIS